MKRYIVIAFYENLCIKKRVTEYSNKSDAYEYMAGLRLCDTPYLAFDFIKLKIFDINLVDGYTEEKMIEALKEDLE